MTATAPSRRGGRRPGAGAPKGNLNAFKHGLCSDRYDALLQQQTREHNRLMLAHMRDLVVTYHRGGLSRAQRTSLVQQAGLTVLTAWYGICQALLAEQSKT